MPPELFLSQILRSTAADIYGSDAVSNIDMQVQKTRRGYAGDYTLVTFPLAKRLAATPADIAATLGKRLQENNACISNTQVVQGFLNISLSNEYWRNQLLSIAHSHATPTPTGKTIMVEYSSPNTNKPLHLGHIRNNLLGASVARILEAAGNSVIKVNLVNDRGIHICKSMLAWQKWGNGITPLSSGKKGDHLVGDFYVLFDKKYKEQIAALAANADATEAATEDEARHNAPIILEAQQMLQQWEQGDAQVRQLWATMNQWVYEGFEQTYRTLGVDFDKTYYESETYLLGKDLVEQGLRRGVFYAKSDGSVWIDLTAEGLDNKLVRRSDGTSVYITQDIGTAVQRYSEHSLSAHIYVVGNEQDYHFQVLKLILHKLGYAWANSIRHLSYGMVELPEGKMKSREGTVVDADDLLQQMFDTARDMAQELGKLDGLSEAAKAEVIRIVGLGALKYYILKVDPQKTMLFNPRESIDFNGNTGAFIQYAYARICSLLRKAQTTTDKAEAAASSSSSISAGGEATLSDKEISLVKLLCDYGGVVAAAADALSPALVANYAYDLAKEYNQFYHDYSILKETNAGLRRLRLVLSEQVGAAINRAMSLLGIEMAQRM
jgi:arginyl-tRNA synthetase